MKLFSLTIEKPPWESLRRAVNDDGYIRNFFIPEIFKNQTPNGTYQTPTFIKIF